MTTQPGRSRSNEGQTVARVKSAGADMQTNWAGWKTRRPLREAKTAEASSPPWRNCAAIP